MKRRWRDEVIERAMRSPNSMVFAGHRFERRALQRMTARGEARPAFGFPGVWVVIFD